MSEQLKIQTNGEKVIIPNLYSLFPNWVPKIHKEYSRARDDVLNPWIQRYVTDNELCLKMQKANFGLFAAIICADVSFEKLCTTAKYFAWYFIWDDLFDCGPLSNDEGEMKRYREASVEYFNFVIGGKGERPDLSIFSSEMENALACWDEVGSHIRKDCTPDACELLLKEMVAYIKSVDTVNSVYNVQKSYSASKLPSLSQYWRRREHTAAVHCVIATLPFIYDIDISVNDITEDIRALWVHTSYIVHITNDMFSMRKELNDGQIENLVPLLMLSKGLSAQEAMTVSYMFCQREAKSFDVTAILVKNSTEHITPQVIEKLLLGCHNVAMGLIHWSYHGRRYFSSYEIDGKYNIEFEL